MVLRNSLCALRPCGRSNAGSSNRLLHRRDAVTVEPGRYASPVGPRGRVGAGGQAGDPLASGGRGGGRCRAGRGRSRRWPTSRPAGGSSPAVGRLRVAQVGQRPRASRSRMGSPPAGEKVTEPGRAGDHQLRHVRPHVAADRLDGHAAVAREVDRVVEVVTVEGPLPVRRVGHQHPGARWRSAPAPRPCRCSPRCRCRRGSGARRRRRSSLDLAPPHQLPAYTGLRSRRGCSPGSAPASRTSGRTGNRGQARSGSRGASRRGSSKRRRRGRRPAARPRRRTASPGGSPSRWSP